MRTVTEHERVARRCAALPLVEQARIAHKLLLAGSETDEAIATALLRSAQRHLVSLEELRHAIPSERHALGELERRITE